MSPPWFPENLTDTKSPEEAKKCKNGTKSKMLSRNVKNAETEGKHDTKEKQGDIKVKVFLLQAVKLLSLNMCLP